MSDIAHTVTDRLIELGHQTGRPLTPLEIQKLLYFVEGWHLALTEAPLFDEEFQAWAHGPALPTVYRRLKGFGAKPVDFAVIDTKPAQALSERVMDIVDQIFSLYTRRDPGALVGLIHLPGTPWDQTRKSRWALKKQKLDEPISTDVIRKWFKDVWAESLKPVSAVPVRALAEEYAGWTEA